MWQEGSSDGLAPSTDEAREQVGRIARSDLFKTSEVLRKLLLFLADRSLTQPSEAIKEHEIATRVLDRAADFDPRVDSTVRVQTARLRAKLAEYYIEPGAGDAIFIEIPKGHYHLVWSLWSGATHAAQAPAVLTTPRRPITVALAVVMSMAGAFAVYALASGSRQSSLRQFWSPFLDSPEAPLVVFSNPRLVGSRTTVLRLFRPGLDSESTVDESYTGTGEVMAVHALTEVFASMKRSVRVKRGGLLTWDEAVRSDVIFLGLPDGDKDGAALPDLRFFRFEPRNAEPRRGEAGIVALEPRANEPPMFSPASGPGQEDYAIIALVPGVDPLRHTLVLAGITTAGTQAAAEFVCRADYLAELLAQIGGTRTRVPFFEAVLHVKVMGSVPVEPKLAGVRVRGR